MPDMPTMRTGTCAYTTAWEKAYEFDERMKSALNSRVSWRIALVETLLKHEPRKNGCVRGAESYPCFTIQALEQVNRGIARQVERFASMSEKGKNAVLYRNDW